MAGNRLVDNPVKDDEVAEITIRGLTAADMAPLEALHARVFGPGRLARTAYRIREAAPPPPGPHCLGAFRGAALLAAVQFTAICIGGKSGALLLGPLAVDAEHAGRGLGLMLVRAGLERARSRGARLVLLVGDAPYYGRAGFSPVPTGQITLPGPVDPARLLAAELEPGALADYRGRVAAVPPAPSDNAQ